MESQIHPIHAWLLAVEGKDIERDDRRRDQVEEYLAKAPDPQSDSGQNSSRKRSRDNLEGEEARGHCIQKVPFHSLTPRFRTAESLGVGHRTGNEASQVSEYSPSRDRMFPYMAPEIAVSNLDGGERGRYDKNPRRKTREDRYEPRIGNTQKSGNHGSGQDSKSKARPRKGRKRSEISGNFQPTNVTSGRLTVGNTRLSQVVVANPSNGQLNSNTKLGIFNMGKTSSPVKLRELPDLTFSEIKFLSKDEEFDRRSIRSNNPKRGELETRQVSQKDISQYFTRSKQQEKGSQLISSSAGQHQNKRRDIPTSLRSNDRHDVSEASKIRQTPTRNVGLASHVDSPVKSRNFCDGNHQRTHSSKGSSPYTWSESADESKQATLNSLELHTRDVLLNGDQTKETEKYPQMCFSSKPYHSLDDLRAISESRGEISLPPQRSLSRERNGNGEKTSYLRAPISEEIGNHNYQPESSSRCRRNPKLNTERIRAGLLVAKGTSIDIQTKYSVSEKLQSLNEPESIRRILDLPNEETADSITRDLEDACSIITCSDNILETTGYFAEDLIKDIIYRPEDGNLGYNAGSSSVDFQLLDRDPRSAPRIEFPRALHEYSNFETTGSAFHTKSQGMNRPSSVGGHFVNNSSLSSNTRTAVPEMAEYFIDDGRGYSKTAFGSIHSIKEHKEHRSSPAPNLLRCHLPQKWVWRQNKLY